MSGTGMVDHAITVGGGITANVVTELLKVLVPSITQNIKSLSWGFKDDLENLKKKFIYVQAVMKDSENIKITKTLQAWLEELRDIAYDTDDVLDDFLYQVTRKETIKSLKNKVRDSFSVSSNNPLYVRLKIASKIKSINKRLEEVLKNKTMFQFPNISSINISTASTVHQGQTSDDTRKTTSFVNPDDASNFVGRDMDRLKIVKVLTSSSSRAEKLPVVPIVGMGGIGKTTLAKFVCKDESVVNCFDPIIWIYVSEIFNIDKIVKEIIDLVTKNNKKCDSSSSREVMVRELHENLCGKKFLLVLDDLWNEDIDDWEALKTALSVGADGSKILVTTRSDQVVSTVRGTIDRYSLAQLNEDECWSIIMKKAFAAGGAKEIPPMVEIGQQIAKKCVGLPLVARTLGSLMYTKKSIGDWESIKKNEVFRMTDDENKIILILKLSYDNLHSQVKRCFSYCCVFPKGYEIERTALINLWMAEGFLQQSGEENGNTMECVGNEYFNHLLQNSLLQDIKEYYSGQTVAFRMHDLMHDLARKVLGDYECSVWKASEGEYISKVRRIQVALDYKEGSALFWKSLSDAKKLRTVVAIGRDSPGMIPEVETNRYEIPSCFIKLQRFLSNRNLRVLSVMARSYYVGQCLASVSKLRHLRYLYLSGQNEDLILKNRGISTLYYLQTLILHRSIEKIPEDIGSLKNLRHLDLRFNDDLEELPQSITNLMSLQTLNLRYCGLRCLPEDFGALKHLKYLHLGHTKIQELPESITDCCYLEILDIRGCNLISAFPSNIGCLNYLRYLDFYGTKISKFPDSCNHGFHSLETLLVTEDCVFSKEVKNWVSLKHIGIPRVWDTRGIPLLRARGIRRLTSLKTMETYFVEKNRGNDDDEGNRIGDLRELNLLEGKLEIRELQNVRGGFQEARSANLQLKQNISHLDLHWCKRFIKVREQVMYDEDASTDEHVEVQEEASTNEFFDGDQEEVVGDELGSADKIIEVEEKVAKDSWISERIVVEEDEVVRDEEVLEGLRPHINLKMLVLKYFLGRKLPSWLMRLLYLVEIKLDCCFGIQQILGLGLLTCLKKLTLFGLYELEKWADPSLIAESQGNCLYPCLEVLDIGLCPNLRVVPSSNFPSLNDLSVQDITATGLSSLLRKNITTLVKVRVSSILGLKFLPVEMFQPSLEFLDIIRCYELQGFASDEEKHSLYFSQMTSLRKVIVQYSEKWKPFKDLQCLPNLEKLELQLLSNQASPVAPADDEAEGIQHLVSLRHLKISEWTLSASVSSIPHQLQYLTNLRGLCIHQFHGLGALPEWLGNLTSLEKLYITDCKNLMRLPSKETILMLTSLRILEVWACPILEEVCADKESEEFQKISHIEIIWGLGGRKDVGGSWEFYSELF